MRENRFVRLVVEMFEIFIQKRVTRSAAELSYYLTLSFFPFFILLYWFAGKLDIDVVQLLTVVRGVVPRETMNVLDDYLGYVSNSQSTAMLIAGVLLMATTSSAAFRSFLHIFDDIYSRKRYLPPWGLIFSFICPVVFLLSIYFGIIILVTGNWFLSLLDHFWGIGQLISNWVWLRFILLFGFLILMVYALYRFISPRAKPRITVVFGAMASSFALVAVSVLFSIFISLSTRYSLVYGSLASIIILMIWLFLCSNILILGGVLNYMLAKRKPYWESQVADGLLADRQRRRRRWRWLRNGFK